MTFDWQSSMVGAAVALAAAYLARRGWRFVRRKAAGGCGAACSGCANSVQEPAPLVQIGLRPHGPAQERP